MFQQKPKSDQAKANVPVEIPWIEKYRPKKIDDVSHQEEVVQVLKKTMESKNLPHLLFYGPPGTGKTSTILALCRDLYGPELMKTRVLELNASDERGIQVIREKVKSFAQIAVSSEAPSNGYPCPPYKIIILDEADSMTKDAQHALRRTMETYSKVTRFCIVCNYISRIIEPLTSRCAKFRFKSLNEENAKSRLEFICQQENVNYGPKTLETILQVADGDLRKAIMLLQSAYRFYGKEELKPLIIQEIAGVIPNEVIDWFFDACKAKSINKVEKAVADIIKAGYSGTQLISQFHDKICLEPSIGEMHKSLICQRVAKVDRCLLDGADEHLQLLDLGTYAISVFTKY